MVTYYDPFETRGSGKYPQFLPVTGENFERVYPELNDTGINEHQYDTTSLGQDKEEETPVAAGVATSLFLVGGALAMFYFFVLKK